MAPMRPSFPDSPVAPAEKRSSQTALRHLKAQQLGDSAHESILPVAPMRPLSPVGPAEYGSCETAFSHLKARQIKDNARVRECPTCGAHEAAVSHWSGGPCMGAQPLDSLGKSAGSAA